MNRLTTCKNRCDELSIKCMAIISIVLVTCVGLSMEDEMSEFLSKKDCKLKADIDVQSIEMKNKMQCAMYCASTTSCNTAAWQHREEICHTSDVHTTDLGSLNFNVEPSSVWTVMSKVFYPVALFEGPAGIYTLSYNKAETLCAEMGFALASPDDLLQSRALGYDLCRCGWLSNGRNGFVIHHYFSVCWQYFSTNIIYCDRNLADVYCKL